METTIVMDPKDDKILNKDDSVTNKDGDNDLEKGKHPTSKTGPDGQPQANLTSGNENRKPIPPEVEENLPSKDGGPAKRIYEGERLSMVFAFLIYVFRLGVNQWKKSK